MCMEGKCSFSSIVGDSCTYQRRDKAIENTDVNPLFYCTREMAAYKSTWGISDVDTEIYLTLARAAIFTSPETNIASRDVT